MKRRDEKGMLPITTIRTDKKEKCWKDERGAVIAHKAIHTRDKIRRGRGLHFSGRGIAVRREKTQGCIKRAESFRDSKERSTSPQ